MRKSSIKVNNSSFIKYIITTQEPFVKAPPNVLSVPAGFGPRKEGDNAVSHMRASILHQTGSENQELPMRQLLFFGPLWYTSNMNLLYLTDYPRRTTKAPLDVLMMRKFQLLCLIMEAEIVFSPFQRYFHLFKEAKNKMVRFATYLKDIGPASGTGCMHSL